jgi:CRISPR-associated protein Csb2
VLIIEVQLLAGRYVATAHNDRDRAEWPPHPTRLFSAMVAALHDRVPVDDKERTVLEEIESAGPPAIEASNVDPDEEVGRRTVNGVYVPANDTTVIDTRKLDEAIAKRNQALHVLSSASDDKSRAKAEAGVQKAEQQVIAAMSRTIAAGTSPTDADMAAASAMLPERRGRQKRTFPSFTPDVDLVRFVWPHVDLAESGRRALSSLLDRVTRLGHSSSLVRCAVAATAQPNLVPARDDESQDWTLRVVGERQLERLEAAFKRHRGIEPRVLTSRPQRYRIVGDDSDAQIAPQGVFSHRDWMVLVAEGDARYESTRCVDIAKALHRALLDLPPQPAPELISGRRADGKPSERPHVALIPLPDVGHEHAHGGVLGIAIVLPRNVSAEERAAMHRIIAEWEMREAHGEDPPLLSLVLTTGGPMLVRRTEAPGPWGLRARTWCRPARRWVTATPIALDRNPGNLRSATTGAAAAVSAKRIVADACDAVGLPRPSAVEVSLGPLLVGTAPVRAFDPFPPEPGRLRRVRVHSEIIFDEPVRGPVLLGAGRYVGLGLCRPVE